MLTGTRSGQYSNSYIGSS